ncbi:MAG: hypothetical protein K0S41_3794 [Anaerocolumna sp.]|jgi:cell division transport system permease protein|nr:hypothetical protein [Anaerocolumna sp.]
MRTFIYNFIYYIKETKNMVRMNLLSNMASLLCTGLIFFMLGLIFTGWSISNGLVDKLKEEAEISVYFKENVDKDGANKLHTDIKALKGVWDASLIDEGEAYSRMEDVLGEEAKILTLFDDNPFEAYIEVRIYLESMDYVINNIERMDGIDFIRDNREILARIQKITAGIKVIGLLSLTAVGITTIIILSHLIRQGIYNNKDQINTLKLLGAPNYFIGFPFVLFGLVITIVGGLFAIIMIHILIHYGFGRLNEAISFIPMPDESMTKRVITNIILLISLVLGVIGSLIGVASIRKGTN